MSTSITIRNIDDEVKRLLRIRAAERGKSMEADLREVLTRLAYSPVREPAVPTSADDEYRSPARGKWKHLGITTEEIMALTRGE